ncbi:uncharacterized protein ARMOST_21737 [Armillaria ostoyae]|uniref:Uncharacterized protein n=1 Tax=Armillaria ostoyae TaxID=47428 RepID=A0A284SAX6_ARMOS|nr:uncharacterized protein ARMOST_21737 [Armillaria ostoyae]
MAVSINSRLNPVDLPSSINTASTTTTLRPSLTATRPPSAHPFTDHPPVPPLMLIIPHARCRPSAQYHPSPVVMSVTSSSAHSLSTRPASRVHPALTLLGTSPPCYSSYLAVPRARCVNTPCDIILVHARTHSLSCSLHRLKRLSIEFIDDDIPELPDALAKPIFDAFEYAPLLRNVSSIEGAPDAPKQINLPWSQLTDYVGNDWMTSYIDVLKLAPAMERISLRCDEDPGLMRRSLLRLTSVFVSFLCTKSKRFSIQISFQKEHPFARVPTSQRVSTARSLQVLIINASFPISVEAQADLVALLKTTASLSRLSLSFPPVPTIDQNHGIFLGLSANTNPDIVPQLTTQAFRFINQEPYVSPSFVDMQSRRPRQAASTRVVLQTPQLWVPAVIPPVDPDVATRWKDLCNEGFVMYKMLQ